MPLATALPALLAHFLHCLIKEELAAIRQPYLTSGRVVTQTDLTKGRPVTYEVAAENAAEVKLQS